MILDNTINSSRLQETWHHYDSEVFLVDLLYEFKAQQKDGFLWFICRLRL